MNKTTAELFARLRDAEKRLKFANKELKEVSRIRDIVFDERQKLWLMWTEAARKDAEAALSNETGEK